MFKKIFSNFSSTEKLNEAYCNSLFYTIFATIMICFSVEKITILVGIFCLGVFMSLLLNTSQTEEKWYELHYNLDDIILYLHRKGFKMVASSSGYYSFKTNRIMIYNEYVVIKDNGQQSLILTDNFHIKEIQKSLEELLYTRQKAIQQKAN